MLIRLGQTLRDHSGFRRFTLSLVWGAVAALALPPLGLWPVLFLAFPLFLLMLEGSRTLRSAFSLGWSFGFGYFLVAFHWIGFAFLVDAKTYLWMMPFAVGGLAAAMAVYWGLAAAITQRLGLQGLRLALGFAALLAIAEWLRGHLFTGFPWAAPGLAVDGMGAVAQVSSAIGMTGLTLLIVLWAGLGIVIFHKTSWRQRAAAIALLLLLPAAWAFGLQRLGGARGDSVPGIAIRIVQPNISQDEKWREDNARHIFDTLKQMSSAPTAERPRGIADVTHVIWPESAVSFLIDESPVAEAELRPMLAGRTVLITGAIRRELPPDGNADQAKVHNSIITFDGNANPVARYDKWRLVPGGEFLPFEWLLEPLGFRKVVTVPGSFAAGPGPVTIAIPNAPKAAMLVCYEAIFPNDLIGPNDRPGFIVNVTNDGWFGNSTGPYQHLAQTRLRAIEQGLPVLRAANTGISAIIDPYGQMTGVLALDSSGVLDGPLPMALTATVYGRFGDGALALLAVLALGFAAVGRNATAPLKFAGTSNN